MSDEIDREITTKKVTSHPNSSVEASRISEQRTTKVSSDNSSGGLILGILLTLAVGAGAFAYFMNNNRPAPTQILVPGTDTVRENKSTVIERNNTTTKEVAPATPQPTPKVEVNLPVTITQPAVPAAPPVPAAPQVQTTVAPAVSPTPQVQTTPVATPRATN